MIDPLSRLLAILALLGLAPTAAPAADAPQATLYTGATVIDGTGGAARADQDILVEGERIVAIGTHDALANQAGTARRVDLSGRFVIPGLIDSHVHLTTPPNRTRAEAILRRQLYGGVPAVRDLADDLRAVGELARASLVGEIPAPPLYSSALMAGPPFFAHPPRLSVRPGFRPGNAPGAQAVRADPPLRPPGTPARST